MVSRIGGISRQARATEKRFLRLPAAVVVVRLAAAVVVVLAVVAVVAAVVVVGAEMFSSCQSKYRNSFH